MFPVFSHYCLIINPLTSLFLLFIFSSQHCTVQLLALNIVIGERNGGRTKIVEKRQFWLILVTSKPKIYQPSWVFRPSTAEPAKMGQKSKVSRSKNMWRFIMPLMKMLIIYKCVLKLGWINPKILLNLFCFKLKLSKMCRF